MNVVFKIEKLIIKGEEYQRTIQFDDKLTIIRGDGYSGKSLVLNLVAYCLGGNTELIDLAVQKELADNCSEVFLQFKINEAVYTVRRSLNVDKNTILIFLCEYSEHNEYSPWKKKVEDANDYFAELLGLKLHFILRRKSGSKDLSPEKISFRDVMRFLYVKQNELGTSHFMQWDNTFLNGKNKEVFKILNDLVIPNIEEIEREIQIAQNEVNEKLSINKGLIDYLNKRDAVVLLQLVDIREKYNEDIHKYSDKKKELVLSYRDSKENEVYALLSQDIYAITNEMHDINGKLSDLRLSLLNKQLLISEYQSEKEKLDATLEALKKIKITEHSEHCPLCNSVINVVYEENNVEDVEVAIFQLNTKLKTLQKLINQDQYKIVENERKLLEYGEKKKIYSNALNEYKRNIEVPFLSEIETYNSLIKDVTGERNKINSLIDIHKEIEENESRIKVLNDTIEKLEKNKKMLQQAEKREENILKELNKQYRILMRRFNFKDTFEDTCYISRDTFLPYYSGNSIIKHTSGSLLLCMGIAYLGAVIEIGIGDERNCRPSILLIDTVANNIGTDLEVKDSLDPKTYIEIYKYLYELSEKNQIILVDNTPPQLDGQKIEYIFQRIEDQNEKLKGLIDETKNEI